MFSKKILVLGNNDQNTDDQARILASKSNSTNWGLIPNTETDTSQFGYYHTTLVDLPPKAIIDLAKQFDEVILLDQPKKDWTDQKLFLSTCKLMSEIEKETTAVTHYKDNKNIKSLNYWNNIFKNNKSFCAYPWIAYSKSSGTGLTTCSRNNIKITDATESLTDWKNNKNFNEIRQKMLDGELLPNRCATCYEYEDRGLTGYRTHDSLDFISKLELETIDDLKNIEKPYYYDIRLGNACNLMCRMCTPVHSSLIYKEFEENPELAIDGQEIDPNYTYSSIDVIDIESLTNKHMVYLTGGEPTVMKEVYTFMRKCVEMNKVDFRFSLGTNAQYFSKPFIDLAKKFKYMHFSVSIDGYGKVNDYIRWQSDFATIISNCHMLESIGCQISWNHVPTIWGIHRTHELFEYVSEHFPFVHLYLQYNRVGLHSAFNSPMPEKVLSSLERCMKTSVYFNDGKDCKSGIDAFYKHYQNYTVNKEHLKKFFNWNDTMDRVRKIQMKDYIPDLDECRNML